MKRLVEVRFTDAPEGAGGRHVDPVSNDVLTNANRLVLLKPSGHVLLEETYLKCVKPDGVYNGALVSLQASLLHPSSISLPSDTC